MGVERRTIGGVVRAALLPATLAGLAIGVAFRLSGRDDVARAAWAATILVALAPLALSTARALRRGTLGVDLIALLAMAGALLLGENLAGAVIALMLSGGQALEAYAHLSRLFVRQLDAMGGDAPSSEDLRDLRRIMYGLYAAPPLHFAQEEEAYLSYVEERLGTQERATSAA